jgi:hypothetical protein
VTGRLAGSLAAFWLMAAGTPGPGDARFDSPPPVLWQIDNLERIGGHVVSVVGAPRVVETKAGLAVEFDGRADGLFVDVNPLEGLTAFTIEVVFEPHVGGAEEQRFLHFEETDTGNRALVELRMLPDGRWCLDTFLRWGEAGLTLIDRSALHEGSRWHAAALAYDGRTMKHYVDGVSEQAGDVAFTPLGAGRTSIGMRQNLVSWFKGRIRLIRISPEALSRERLLIVDAH